MARKALYIDTWVGGASMFTRIAPANGYYKSTHIDIHRDYNQLTLKKKPVKISGSVVTDLIHWMHDGSPFDAKRYLYGNAGCIYSCDSDGTNWAKLRTLSAGLTATAQGALTFNNNYWYATDKTIGKYGLLNGTPAFNDDVFTDGSSNVDQENIISMTGAYTPPVAISESDTEKKTFIPNRDPLTSVLFKVVTKGTGNWTVTLHDSNNVSLGTVTISNASLVVGDNTFTFSSPVRMILGNEYHFHVTSTVADGTMRVYAANDLETAYFQTFFGILVGGTLWHPFIEHVNGWVVGNERYLGFFDQAIYNPNQIVLSAGFQVNGLAKDGEYVVASCFQGSTYDKAEKVRWYYWDGISPTWNFYRDVSAGVVNTAGTYNNALYAVHGQHTSLYRGADQPEPIFSLPTTNGKKIYCAPQSITSYQERMYIAYGYSGDDSAVPVGVYEYGRKDGYPTAFTGHSYTMSTGGDTISDNEKIGAVQGFGTDMMFSWQDDTSYGVDRVAETNDDADTGILIDIQRDNGILQKPKQFLNAVVSFQSLSAGQSVTLTIGFDNGLNITETQSVEGATQLVLQSTPNLRYRILQYQLELTSAAGIAPVIFSAYLEYDDLDTEINFDSNIL
jgi:hypothetical protein